MKKARYMLLQLGDTICKNIKTGQIFKKEIELCNYTADDNSIYYEYPQPEPIENYVIEADGTQEPLINVIPEELKNRWFAVICANSKIGGIEKFYYKPTSKYFCVEITEQLKNLLEDIGLDKLTVCPAWNGFSLNNIHTGTNCELIYFIDSQDDKIRQVLNGVRYNTTVAIIQDIGSRLFNKGTTIWSDGQPIKIDTSPVNLDYIAVAAKHKEEVLYNHNRLLNLGSNTVNDLNTMLHDVHKHLIDYIEAYSSKLLVILQTNPTLSQLEAYGNFLEFGYTFGETDEIHK